ncbi:MAG: heme exporter protein CcmD [Legionella sp.]|nr:heme exporter protein CcmD [Legionella sp.]
MNSLFSFLSMGGYASYVWPAYTAVFAVFITHLIYAKNQRKRVMRMLKRRLRHRANHT